MNQDIIGEIEALQGLIREQIPEAQFKLVAPEDEKSAWSLFVYTPAGNMHMPANVMGGLDDISRKHRLTILAIVYPLTLFEE